jgi:hypothetical protein
LLPGEGAADDQVLDVAEVDAGALSTSFAHDLRGEDRLGRTRGEVAPSSWRG